MGEIAKRRGEAGEDGGGRVECERCMGDAVKEENSVPYISHG